MRDFQGLAVVLPLVEDHGRQAVGTCIDAVAARQYYVRDGAGGASVAVLVGIKRYVVFTELVAPLAARQ